MISEDSTNKDATYEKQISEANELGNALLSGLLMEGINENKKNIKISSLINLSDLLESYKNELEKLKTLQIGSCHDIITLKRSNNCGAQIELNGKILQKIEDILLSHVKHDESKVISKEELSSLQSQMVLLNSMQKQLEKVPESQESLKNHLKIIGSIQANLENITSTINSAKSKVDDLQQAVISNSSDMLYYSI